MVLNYLHSICINGFKLFTQHLYTWLQTKDHNWLNPLENHSILHLYIRM